MRKEYERYKPTGIEWISQIPAHWDWSFLSQVASEQKIKKPKDKMYPVMSLSYGQIIRKKNIDVGLVPASYDNYQFVSNGNIILRFTDLQNDHTSLRTGLVKEDGIITSAYTNIQPKINSVFLSYLLHSYDTMKIFYGMGGGVRQSIGFKDVRYLQIPVPPRKEQDQIARFLDWKVSGINKLIHIKKKEIDELKALKSTVISKVVTQGLNPIVETKPTGIEWLPQIPEHWEVWRNKHVFTERKEIVGSNLDQYVLLSLTLRGILPRDLNAGGKFPSSFENYKIVMKGDIAFCLFDIDETPRTVGFSEYDGMLTGAYTIMKVHDCNPRYVFYYYLALDNQKALRPLYSGLRKTINIDRFQGIKLPVPPRAEQDQIVRFLEQRTSQIIKLVEIKQTEIQGLHDLKTRLIADAVTGKIDVQNITVPEYEHVEDTADDDSERESEVNEGLNEEED